VVYGDSIRALEKQHVLLADEKKLAVTELSGELKIKGNVDTAVKRLAYINARQEVLRREARSMIKDAKVSGETNDTNYIFLRFVIDHLPRGLIGLLIAVIFLAAWGSIAAALNSLASASVVDIHKKFIQKDLTEEQDYKLSKWYSLFWGLFCVGTAMFVTGMGSLIEAVNVLGSWFYGIILGIFLVAFYIKSIGGKAIFWGAIISQILILLIYWRSELAWLWLNVIGAALVIGISFVLNLFFRKSTDSKVQA
jgi:Na+/proline symporter